tara:strand:+ start:679 stop:888 length:210 start_codon:yes stop_codon:yes gene_type:complete
MIMVVVKYSSYKYNLRNISIYIKQWITAPKYANMSLIISILKYTMMKKVSKEIGKDYIYIEEGNFGVII